VVVSHDPELNPDHTRDATGQFLSRPGPVISAVDYAELARFDVGRIRPGTAYQRAHPQQQALDGERIPRLAELYALIHGRGDSAVRLNIEIKIFPLQPELTAAPAVFVQALLAVVEASGMAAATTIQCFDWRVLNCVQHLAPGMATGALTDQQGADDTVQFDQPSPSPWLGGLDARQFGGSVPRLAKASRAGTWSPNYLDLGTAQVVEAHSLGLLVVPWTVNEVSDMERILAMDVDGMITDRPDLLLAMLRDQGLAARTGGRV